MPRVGLIYHPDYLKHDTGPHPERAERLTAILERLKSDGLYEALTLIEPEPATEEDLFRVHAQEHIDRVREACRQGEEYLDVDTSISPESYQVALLAAGGAMAACREVMTGEISRAFCLIRPPGHHATREAAMGFCLFNNVAVAARYLQAAHRLSRILIVDWDLHHGNGTQEIFYGDDSVFYFSCHQRDHYPFTGWERERGQGKGQGYTLNLPLTAATPADEIVAAVQGTLTPKAADFKPEFILVSAGFDAHRDDPLGNLTLTEESYKQLTRMVCRLADTYCQGRVVSCLEGGYHLGALASSVAAHIRAMLEE